MNDFFLRMVEGGWRLAAPATEEGVGDAAQALGLEMPDPYREFLLLADGAEADGGGLRLFGCGELVARNRGYQVPDFLPGYLMIGDDGGDSFYFMKSGVSASSEVFLMLSGAFFEDEAEHVGKFGESFPPFPPGISH